MPVSILMVVDLPAPLGPRIPSIWPEGTVKEMFFTAWIWVWARVSRFLRGPRGPRWWVGILKVFERLWTSMAFWRALPAPAGGRCAPPDPLADSSGASLAA